MVDFDYTRLICGKRIRDFVGYHEAILCIAAAIITALVTIGGNYMPVDIMPTLALMPIMGLLFGPFASIGAIAIILVENVVLGADPGYCAINALSMFLVSYIPYRMWYSSFMHSDDRPPVLDSVKNIAKFILVMVVSSLVYTILYNVTAAMFTGAFALGFEDVVRFMNVLSFSFLFGMAAILLLRYIGVEFYTPRFGGTPDDWRRRIDHNLFDLGLIAGMVLPICVLITFPEGWSIPLVGTLTYLLLIFYLMKPVEPARTGENMVQIGGLRFNKFNRSLLERLIVIFIAYAIVMCVVFAYLTYAGVLVDVFDWGFDVTVLFYMSMALIMFFLPALIFLWYIERNVTVPVEEISEAAMNFIDDEHMASSKEFNDSCRDYLDQDSEIGNLARSLSKMTSDIENYISGMRALYNQQEMYRAELNVAQNIQESFIPTNFDLVEGKGASVYGIMDSAKYVGGDLYDFFMIDNDHLGIAIGDVSGKGVPAALFMVVAKSSIEGHARPGSEPNEIMGKVNINLCRNNIENMFVSAWIGTLELSTGKLRFSSAGHNPPVLVRTGQTPELLRTKSGLVLGAREGIVYPCDEIVLEPGDRILLYTDGVTEANDHFRGFYGTERLMAKMDACRDMHPSEEVPAIMDDIKAFTDEADQFDDITMLLVKYEGISREPLLDGEDVVPVVAPVADAVDALPDEVDA